MMKILNKIKEAINKAQMWVYGWLEKDKKLHLFVGMMVFMWAFFPTTLGSSIAMLIVTAVAVLKELFDKYRHLLGFSKGSFDKVDLVATMMGGAIMVALVGLIDLIKILI